MEDYQVLKLLSKAFEIGYTKAVVDYGDLKPQMSKNEAYQRYGRKTVDRWINEGLIKLLLEFFPSCTSFISPSLIQRSTVFLP